MLKANKLYELSSIIVISLVVVALVGVASSYYLGDDNALEELSEDVIEGQTGLKVDLSPNSKEG